MAKPRVLIAMSGGVDSSVATALMKKRGYDVIGLTMQIWQESQTDPRHAGCCSLGAVEDARRVSQALDIPHFVMNFREEFREAVIEDFVDQYARGRTPNPCVRCNRFVKFEILLQKMHELGCERLVTGHYARIRKGGDGYRLLMARGNEKDQSYVLYMLGQDQLQYLHFPLGELPNKNEARKLARELGLVTADKPDSQEICFVSEAGGYFEFLKKQRPEIERQGVMVDSGGKTLGTHSGIASFTVGQRRGLGVADGRPLYVLKLEPKENRVIVGSNAELMSTEVPLEDMFWMAPDTEQGIPVQAKVRYNMPVQPATLYGGTNPRLVFRKPVRAATPGQIAVAYRGKTVVAGGTIQES